jgi:hypothetical protein
MTLLSTFNVFSLTLAGILASGCVSAQSAGRGMPPEAQAQIQALFDGHEKVRRTVTQTEDGYQALTESDDPKVAAALKKHVKQMEARLESGLRVRRWDPAFEEYVAHYADMTHAFEVTEKGVKATVKGKTAVAVKVARNHASVVSAFAAEGWPEHDRKHPAVTQ